MRNYHLHSSPTPFLDRQSFIVPRYVQDSTLVRNVRKLRKFAKLKRIPNKISRRVKQELQIFRKWRELRIFVFLVIFVKFVTCNQALFFRAFARKKKRLIAGYEIRKIRKTRRALIFSCSILKERGRSMLCLFYLPTKICYGNCEFYAENCGKSQFFKNL